MSKSSATRGGRRSNARSSAPADITTYSAAVRYLHDHADVERMRIVQYDSRTFKLDRMRRLLAALEDPQDKVRTVHIAGTVGKGSTSAMIAAMLKGCGYAAGTFTSPHLIDVRERIAVNGTMITKAEFTATMKSVQTAASSLDEEPTFFELITAAAFLYFAEQAVDLAVIETGLGGRLDSTNVITPDISVVTGIDYDHTHILGLTLPEIAREKAGIFKREVPAITFEQPAEILDTFRACAEEVGAPLRVVNDDIEFSYRFCASPELGPHMRVCLFTRTSRFEHLPVPLPGEHQTFNCGLALAVIDHLKQTGFDCPEDKLTAGLAATETPGRMQVVWNRPRILVDGAHNAVSVSALMRSVGAHVPYDSMVCIFGCCQDKDIPAMLDRVNLGADKVIFTKTKSNPRAVDPEELQRAFSERSGKMCQVARSIPEALELASRAVARDDLICVTGSFYLVGETMKYLADLEKKRGK